MEPYGEGECEHVEYGEEPVDENYDYPDEDEFDEAFEPFDGPEFEARELLKALFEEEQCMPIMVRLAFHDAGTYSVEDENGGANGTIRFSPELEYTANTGLSIAMELLEPIKESVPDISYADLYQLAGVVAVEAAGGPKISYKMGRADGAPEDCVEDGRLPSPRGNPDHLRSIFYRMGFNDQEIVLLSGAHCLGKMHEERSGFDGQWTHEPLVFDNSYFVELLKEEADEELVQMPTDKAIVEDEMFKEYVEKYAADNDLFSVHYARAHRKMSELGMAF